MKDFWWMLQDLWEDYQYVRWAAIATAVIVLLSVGRCAFGG